MIELVEKTDVVINEDQYKASRVGEKDGSWQGVSKYVSAYDLHKALDLTPQDTIPNEVLLCYLWDLGIDTQHHAVIEQEVWHRPLAATTKAPVFATRWVGQERSDYEWINSGYASTEARLDNAKFSDLADEIRMLSRQSNFTAEILTHVKERKNVSGRKDGKVSALGGHG